MHRGGESSAKTKRVHGCKYALQTQRGGLGHQNIKGTNQGVRNKICKEHRASESSKIAVVNNVLLDKVPQIVETISNEGRLALAHCFRDFQPTVI